MSRKSLHKLRYLTLAVRAACYSLLLVNAARVQADQTGGIIRDGTGNINQNGLNTTINQTSQNSLTTARAENNGEGGVVKVLGDKVGLFG